MQTGMTKTKAATPALLMREKNAGGNNRTPNQNHFSIAMLCSSSHHSIPLVLQPILVRFILIMHASSHLIPSSRQALDINTLGSLPILACRPVLSLTLFWSSAQSEQPDRVPETFCVDHQRYLVAGGKGLWQPFVSIWIFPHPPLFIEGLDAPRYVLNVFRCGGTACVEVFSIINFLQVHFHATTLGL